jgi:hypothetical protein
MAHSRYEMACPVCVCLRFSFLPLASCFPCSGSDECMHFFVDLSCYITLSMPVIIVGV